MPLAFGKAGHERIETAVSKVVHHELSRVRIVGRLCHRLASLYEQLRSPQHLFTFFRVGRDQLHVEARSSRRDFDAHALHV